MRRRGVNLRKGRKPAFWMVAAVLLWVLGGLLDRTTEIEVYSDGGRLHLEVAGSDLSAPMAVERLTEIEIRAMDSIDPPRGRRIVVEGNGDELINERLPRRFRFPHGMVKPVGDWELDELAGWASVWSRSIEVGGAFSVTATFGGRFHHDLEIVLHGAPTAFIAVRRGLINNDAFIRSADGTTLAVTSIDPSPLADIGAILATLLRAVAVASLLIAIFAVLGVISPPAHRPPAAREWVSAPWAAVLAVSAAALSIWVARSVLEGLPHLPDSVSYLIQSRWLLEGRLWGSVTAFQDYLDVPYTYVVGNRWLSHYLPGWPLLLSIGLAAGTPWLIAPVLGGIYVTLLFLTGRELDGPATGILAAILGLLSPLVRLVFGSLLSHASAATLILAAVWLLLLTRRRRDWRLAALGGIALGLAFGIRPLTAVAAGIPLAAVMVSHFAARSDRESRHCATAWLVGAAVATLPTLIFNHLITGHLFSFPYSLAGKPIYLAANLPFGVRNLDALLYSAGAMLHGWGWPHFHGVLWVALAFGFALVPFLVRRHTATDVLLAMIVVAVVSAHLGSRGHGLHGFGPRYLFEVFSPLFLLTARGFVELARPARGRRLNLRQLSVAVSGVLFVILCGTAATSLPQRLSLYHGYNGIDGSLGRLVNKESLERALVLLSPDDWRGWASAARMMDPNPEADLLFIQAESSDPKIWTIAGDRPIYVWREGQLTAVEQIVEEVEAQASP